MANVASHGTEATMKREGENNITITSTPFLRQPSGRLGLGEGVIIRVHTCDRTVRIEPVP